MASKKVRNIHPGMLHACWVEENALRIILPEKDPNAGPATPTTWHNEEFPIGPAATMKTLKEKYDE